nr:AAA domain-containing protein [Mycoplasmopsis bovis]
MNLNMLHYYFCLVELKNNANIWSIKIKNDGAFVNNESLVRKLDNDFNIDATFDNESDNLNLAYTEYCQKILSQCDDERWEIDNSVYLSNFDFSKIHIYKDIETNIEKIIDSDFFKNLMDLENDIDSSTNEINEANIDSKIDVFEQYKILDSDSSQEIAVQNAIRGKSFVLQGPPGTGKSQTITNIITELISRNKKILFVAEKNALLCKLFIII